MAQVVLNQSFADQVGVLGKNRRNDFQVELMACQGDVEKVYNRRLFLRI